MNENAKGLNLNRSSAIFIATILIANIVASLASIILSELGLDSTLSATLANFILQLSMLTVVLVASYRFGSPLLKEVGFDRKVGIIPYLIVIPISLVCIYSFLPLNNLFIALLQKSGYTISTIKLDFTNPYNVILYIITIAVAPAICEELFIRGAVLNGFMERGSKFAILMSAACFSLMHLNPAQLFYQFLIGVVMASLAVATRSIKPSMLLHFFNNFIVIMVVLIWGEEGNTASIDIGRMIFEAIIYTILGILAISLLIWLYASVLSVHKIKPKNDKLSSEDTMCDTDIVDSTVCSTDEKTQSAEVLAQNKFSAFFNGGRELIRARLFGEKTNNNRFDSVFIISILGVVVIWIINFIAGWLV